MPRAPVPLRPDLACWAGYVFSGLAALPVGQPSAAQDRPATVTPAPALTLAAGLVTHRPVFRYGPEAVRIGLRFEPRTTGLWRLQIGAEFWVFAIGCDAIIDSHCDPHGFSADGALALFPLAGRSHLDPFGAVGFGIVRGPDAQLGLLPDGRLGVDFAARKPVALRLEGRFQPFLRHQLLDVEGHRRWMTEEALAVLVGIRIRLRKRRRRSRPVTRRRRATCVQGTET